MNPKTLLSFCQQAAPCWLKLFPSSVPADSGSYASAKGVGRAARTWELLIVSCLVGLIALQGCQLFQPPDGVAASTAKLYVVGSNHLVVQAHADGSSPQSLGNPGGFLSIPFGITLEPTSQTMYIASFLNDKIVRANLDGTSAESLGNPGGLLNRPTDVALDLP